MRIYAFALEIADVRAQGHAAAAGRDAAALVGRRRPEAKRRKAKARAPIRSPTRCSTRSTASICRARNVVALADAHIFDLYDDPMPTLAALEDYCRAAAAGPMRWAARILGADLDAPSARAFDDAGVALGLTRLLRAPA